MKDKTQFHLRQKLKNAIFERLCYFNDKSERRRRKFATITLFGQTFGKMVTSLK